MKKMVATLGTLATLAFLMTTLVAWRVDDARANEYPNQNNACGKQTVLAFKNAFRKMKLPTTLNKTLGTVDIHCYRKIRVTARLRGALPQGTMKLLLSLHDDGTLSVPLDTLDLRANTDGISRVYETVGLSLNLLLAGEQSQTIDGLDLVIYGQN